MRSTSSISERRPMASIVRCHFRVLVVKIRTRARAERDALRHPSSLPPSHAHLTTCVFSLPPLSLTFLLSLPSRKHYKTTSLLDTSLSLIQLSNLSSIYWLSPSLSVSRTGKREREHGVMVIVVDAAEQPCQQRRDHAVLRG